jgi:hypothetical protein
MAPYEVGDAPIRDDEGTARLDDDTWRGFDADWGTACGGGGSMLKDGYGWVAVGEMVEVKGWDKVGLTLFDNQLVAG